MTTVTLSCYTDVVHDNFGDFKIDNNKLVDVRLCGDMVIIAAVYISPFVQDKTVTSSNDRQGEINFNKEYGKITNYLRSCGYSLTGNWKETEVLSFGSGLNFESETAYCEIYELDEHCKFKVSGS